MKMVLYLWQYLPAVVMLYLAKLTVQPLLPPYLADPDTKPCYWMPISQMYSGGWRGWQREGLLVVSSLTAARAGGASLTTRQGQVRLNQPTVRLFQSAESIAKIV